MLKGFGPSQFLRFSAGVLLSAQSVIECGALTTGALQTPLLLLDVLMLATVPIGTALWVVFADVLMILFGLFGAITSHHYRLGLWPCRVRLSLGQIYRFKPKYNRLEVYGDRFVGQHPL